MRNFVRERVHRLKAASIKPTLKRIVFVERTLANHSKLMLLSLADKAGPAAMTWSLKWCAVFKSNCSSSNYNNKN